MEKREENREEDKTDVKNLDPPPHASSNKIETTAEERKELDREKVYDSWLKLPDVLDKHTLSISLAQTEEREARDE